VIDIEEIADRRSNNVAFSFPSLSFCSAATAD
jgi:hypothetical protein